MKNKFFKRIKDEKQRKHGKGSNKTHDFDSFESPLEPETNPVIPTQSSSTLVPSSIPETSNPVLEGSDEEAEHPEAQVQAFRDYQLARNRVRRLRPSASCDRRLSWIFRERERGCTSDGFRLRSRSEGPITLPLTDDVSTRLIPHSYCSASCLSLGSSLLLPVAIVRGGANDVPLEAQPLPVQWHEDGSESILIMLVHREIRWRHLPLDRSSTSTAPFTAVSITPLLP
ncbi:hypothetical protein M9H77_08793 [Catharanthus roseus]|uniref:Uncharacterized protein n=1 Tax=Catharanthus roseus TaxID=4058 RepID=A0ACC0BYR6_CATRO|nr:hypothetical protein M9H77_08793 [Catharanthus roseus]